MNMPSPLHRLTRIYGVQTVYRDGLKQPREAPAEAILLALQALGASTLRLDDIDDAFRQRRQALWQRVVEPVTVVWENQPLLLKVRLPCQLAKTPSSYRIVLESGEAIEGELGDDPKFTSVGREVEATRYLTRRLLGPASIPFGYHRLYLHIGALEVDSFLICAPIHAYTADERGAKRWGLFCPLYALHSERSWGAGDFSDLAQLSEYTAEM
ncbi:MAG TPA: hypothetical protein VK200_03845, partial [Candidatus Limnocylindrales bacterium]|nr:hypothetical protein [Candidatus Limnocylindrales bacterium]